MSQQVSIFLTQTFFFTNSIAMSLQVSLIFGSIIRKLAYLLKKIILLSLHRFLQLQWQISLAENEGWNNSSFCIKKLILIEGLNGGESSVAGARRNQRASSRNRLLSPQPPVKIDLLFYFKIIFKRFLDVSSI